MAQENNELTAEEKRAQRRIQRNLRHAHASGLMQGILSLLRPDDVVFDCGANVGDVTAPLAATGAQVHAFEPDPYAFGELSKRVGELPNVALYNAAVGARAGKITLFRAANFDDNPKGGSVKSTMITGGRNINDDAQAGIEVDLISLPDKIAEIRPKDGKIAFLKMDIEGAELELLELMLEQDLFDQVNLTVAETHEHKFKALRRAVSEKFPITQVNLDWI